MAAPAYQTGASATGTSSLAVTIPSGVTVGHWAFLGVMLGGATAIPSTPTGWTLVGSAGTGSNPKLAVYKRQIQSGDASSTVTLIGSGGDSEPKHALLVVFDGDGSASVHDAISPGSFTNVSWTATTMAVGQKTLRFAFAYNSTAQPVFTWDNSGSLADTQRKTASSTSVSGATVMTSGVADSAASTGGTEAAETVSWVPTSLSAGMSLVLGGAAATVAGVVAALTLAAPPGTASTGTSATVTGPTATIMAAAPAGTSAGGAGSTVAGVPATVAAAAPAGTVLAEFSIASWTIENTQRLNFDVELSGTLSLDVAPVDPPAGLETDGPDIINFDFDGDLVLDGNGRPI